MRPPRTFSIACTASLRWSRPCDATRERGAPLRPRSRAPGRPAARQLARHIRSRESPPEPRRRCRLSPARGQARARRRSTAAAAWQELARERGCAVGRPIACPRSVRLPSARIGNELYACSSAPLTLRFGSRWRNDRSRFSSTLRLEKIPRPSGTWTMPRRAILKAGIRVTSRPTNVTDPEVAVTRPLTTLATVDFPAPFEPRRATIAPSLISNVTPNSAR